jgi:hypothetical protein
MSPVEVTAPRRRPPTYNELRQADAAVAAAQARLHSAGTGFAQLMAAAHARLALGRRCREPQLSRARQLSLTCCLQTLDLEWLLHGPLLGAMEAVLMRESSSELPIPAEARL